MHSKLAIMFYFVVTVIFSFSPIISTSKLVMCNGQWFDRNSPNIALLPYHTFILSDRYACCSRLHVHIPFVNCSSIFPFTSFFLFNSFFVWVCQKQWNKRKTTSNITAAQNFHRSFSKQLLSWWDVILSYSKLPIKLYLKELINVLVIWFHFVLYSVQTVLVLLFFQID